MARLPYPDRKTFPQELQDFLAQVPEHLNFDMMSYSQSTIESFIRQGEAQYTGLELPPRSRYRGHRDQREGREPAATSMTASGCF